MKTKLSQMKFLSLSILLLPIFCRAQSVWKYSEHIDQKTSKSIYVATLTSSNKLNFKFPYDGGQAGIIEVDNINGHNQVLLSVTKGQFATGENGMNITIKFDDKKPKMFRCGNMPSGQSDEIYIDADKRFITKVKQAKVILIQAAFYDEVDKVIEFDVSGFDWNH
ncbi:MAG: hypothetical protein JWQ63_4360 [Mucilaginibacter sp.]|nr:hypothetical protein [Mucilaginibacter sp.]